MKFSYSDGGRSRYFKTEHVGDCVCRAICNATGMDYMEVYKALEAEGKAEGKSKGRQKRSSARNGVHKTVRRKYIESLGWVWHPTMQIGQGCKVHLNEAELPAGTLIVSVSHHLTCVKDGVLYDTYDCTRNGTRCVYGYYTKV